MNHEVKEDLEQRISHLHSPNSASPWCNGHNSQIHVSRLEEIEEDRCIDSG